MSKSLSGRYCKELKKVYKKVRVKDINISLKKKKQRWNGCKWYKNLSEYENQTLVVYRKK